MKRIIGLSVLFIMLAAQVYAGPRITTQPPPDATGGVIAGSVKSLDVNDGNITNVGDIALDSISADGGSLIDVPTGQNIRAVDGILFNSKTAPANMLNNYAESVYVPTVVCSTSGSFTPVTATTLAATRIGRDVHVQGNITINGDGACNGVLRISLPPGLAVTDLTENAERFYGSAVLYDHGGSIPNGVSASAIAGATYFYLVTVPDNGTAANIDQTHVDAAFGIGVDFTYISE